MSLSQSELQAEVERLVTKHRVPGAVVARWQNGTLCTAAAGLGNLNTNAPMTVDTGFLTGSITKVWATTLVMVLVEEGLLDLDVPIMRYAPDVQFGADDEVARSLTLRHLLNHSSGVDSGVYYLDSRGYPDGVEDYRGPLARAGRLTRPGIVSSYNNMGWVVLEMILRRLTGQNFDQLLRERVIRPLGLRRTVLSAREAILHSTAIGSLPDGAGGHRPTPQFMLPDALAAAGTTLITTVEDTIRFLRLHLSCGTSAEGHRLLRPESVAAMRTPSSPDPTGRESGFGLGWRYLDRGHLEHGRRILHHSGGSPGGIAGAAIAPADDTAVISYVNSFVSVPLHAEIFELLLPAGMSPLAAPEVRIRDEVDRGPFVGRYRCTSERIDIIADRDELLVRVTPVAKERVGATVSLAGRAAEFRAAPTSDRSLISLDESYFGRRATLAFSEYDSGGYQLLFMAGRLARRAGDAP
jgi:CubicO group peptidase (beta-lactamase class C family)